MEKINITGVPETMLQTLYARAAYSQRPDHKFYDAKAIEIVSRIDYDFTKAGKDALMSNGVIKDVSPAEGMVQMMPAYKLAAWIPVIRSISNKLTVLECGA